MSSFVDQITTGLKPLDHQPRKARTHRLPDIYHKTKRRYERRPVTEQQIIHLLDEVVGLSRFAIADALDMNPDYLLSILYAMKKRGLVHSIHMNMGHEPAIWHVGARP